MRKALMTVIAIGLLFDCRALYSQDIWSGKDGNIRNVDTRAMLIDEKGLYLATRNEVYRASDSKDKWQAIFSLPTGENEINCLGGTSKNVLVGTKRGLFRSQDQGRGWNNIFRTILPEKNNILSIEMPKYNSKKILIGTEKGVFSSEDSGNSWKDISGVLKNRRVKCVAVAKGSIYACGDDGLYIKKGEASEWERIYVRIPIEKVESEEVSDSVEVENDSAREVNCIAFKDAAIYVGIGKQILSSGDNGKSWQPFPSEGLTGTVNCIEIVARADKIYCSTTKSIFEFSKEKTRWVELYKGIDRQADVSKIIFDGTDEKSIWALTDKGLYKLEIGRYVSDQYIDVERNLKSMKIIFSNEPTFRELRQAALKFNEVDPDKIKRWRTEARAKALLPKVSLGVNKDRSSKSEIYTSATKDYVAVGPDDISNGLDVSVSWELGDLIWSDSQTSIDVRSRLTTELRNDILDDLRRVYFERRRLQFEFMAAPPKDSTLRFEKEMRIQELTQAIDDLTGNYLSEHTKASVDS